MCGISGSVDAGGSDRSSVADRQLAQLHHRGPDAAGAFEGSAGIVAQNRLAIIDVAGGDPPLTNEDGSVGAVLNGEIYNFRILQRELAQRGHTLASHCDTEVIAHLAEELSPESLAQSLDGMFAFAVWDRRRELLTLGRDRLGKKPLYYFSGPGLFVFGSEIKAVLAHPAVPRDLDESAIPAYLTFGYVPSPRTFFAGVRSLPPGHVLTVAKDGEPQVSCYWRPPRAQEHREHGQTLAESAGAVRNGLRAAVQRRLVADVPLGAFLSGGIDSSAVVGLMSELLDRPVETFTIGFEEDQGFDERPYARMVAERHRTNHHEFVVKPDAVELIERLVWHHDQPFGDSSAVPTFLLSELTRRHVTVALAGDGGDELFAGYERFAAGLIVDRYTRLPRLLRDPIRRTLHRLPASAARGRLGSLQRFSARADLGMPDAYRSWISFVPDEYRGALLRRPDDWALDQYREIWSESAGAPTLDRLLDVNLRTYLLDDLLVKVDRTSMAHGLEVRSPFLDDDLLALAAALPPAHKLRGFTLKRVLKAAVADLVPAPILSRRKRGFGIPLDRWFRTDLAGYVEATLLASDARLDEHLHGNAVRQLVSEHMSRSHNHGHALWTLLTLEVFLRRQGW